MEVKLPKLVLINKSPKLLPETGTLLAGILIISIMTTIQFIGFQI